MAYFSPDSLIKELVKPVNEMGFISQCHFQTCNLFKRT